MATHSSVLAWEIHGQRSLVGYSPWGCKESDTTRIDLANTLTLINYSPFPTRVASLVAQLVKNLPTMQEIRVQFLGQEDPLEKEMATYSSILAWRIPWTEEPGRLQSTGSQKSRHDLATKQQQRKDRNADYLLSRAALAGAEI